MRPALGMADRGSTNGLVRSVQRHKQQADATERQTLKGLWTNGASFPIWQHLVKEAFSSAACCCFYRIVAHGILESCMWVGNRTLGGYGVTFASRAASVRPEEW